MLQENQSYSLQLKEKALRYQHVHVNLTLLFGDIIASITFARKIRVSITFRAKPECIT